MADRKAIEKAYNLGFSDARNKAVYTEAVIEVFVGELDALGFRDPDEEVNGGDLVEVVGHWLPALRKIAGGTL